jgi:hypothetical protein
VHSDEHRPVGPLAEVVDVDDIRVRQAGSGLGLDHEAVARRLVVDELGAQQLDSYDAGEALVASPVDLGRPALADLLYEPVAVRKATRALQYRSRAIGIVAHGGSVHDAGV